MQDDQSNHPAGPLAGVRVLDMTSIFMGPLATQQLADLGADVIKIESPQGDSTRGLGPGSECGLGALFLGLNRNKRSVVLDLKTEAGRQVLLKLAEQVDVLVYNIRPAAMARLGLTYEALSAINPKLLYVGLVGFSQRGRYAKQAAFDDLIQAASGMSDIIGKAGATAPRYLPMAIADRLVGLYAFGIVSAALYEVAQSGRGKRIDVPMFETMLSQVLGDHLYGATFVPPRGGLGYPRLLSPQRRPYATRDGYICCTVYTDAQWRAFLGLIGTPGLFDTDTRFASIATRTANIDALYGMVSQHLEQRSTHEWMDLLHQADIPCFPMHTLESVLEDPHLDDIAFFKTVEHPELGSIRQMSEPSEWSEGGPRMRSVAPMLGADTQGVLRECGFSPEEITQLTPAAPSA